MTTQTLRIVIDQNGSVGDWMMMLFYMKYLIELIREPHSDRLDPLSIGLLDRGDVEKYETSS